jgi:hypothetical protein
MAKSHGILKNVAIICKKGELILQFYEAKSPYTSSAIETATYNNCPCSKPIPAICDSSIPKQDRLCMYNVTLSCVLKTTVDMEKQ